VKKKQSRACLGKRQSKEQGYESPSCRFDFRFVGIRRRTRWGRCLHGGGGREIEGPKPNGGLSGSLGGGSGGREFLKNERYTRVAEVSLGSR